MNPISNSERRTALLDVEQAGEALYVTPKQSIGSLLDLEMREDWLKLSEPIKNHSPFVVVDLSHLSYFGSAVLDWMISLWKQAKQQGGGLALCKVSPIGVEVLRSANLDRLWLIRDSREEATQALRESLGGGKE